MILSLRLAAAGVVVAVLTAGGLYVAHLRAEVGRLGETLTTAEHAARTNAAAAAAIRQDAERKLSVLAEERDVLAQRTARVVVIKEKISRASQSDDGPVAPVLCAALDGMWGTAPAAGIACRTDGGAGQPALLPSAPAPAPR